MQRQTPLDSAWRSLRHRHGLILRSLEAGAALLCVLLVYQCLWLFLARLFPGLHEGRRTRTDTRVFIVDEDRAVRSLPRTHDFATREPALSFLTRFSPDLPGSLQLNGWPLTGVREGNAWSFYPNIRLRRGNNLLINAFGPEPEWDYQEFYLVYTPSTRLPPHLLGVYLNDIDQVVVYGCGDPASNDNYLLIGNGSILVSPNHLGLFTLTLPNSLPSDRAIHLRLATAQEIARARRPLDPKEREIKDPVYEVYRTVSGSLRLEPKPKYPLSRKLTIVVSGENRCHFHFRFTLPPESTLGEWFQESQLTALDVLQSFGLDAGPYWGFWATVQQGATGNTPWDGPAGEFFYDMAGEVPPETIGLFTRGFIDQPLLSLPGDVLEVETVNPDRVRFNLPPDKIDKRSASEIPWLGPDPPPAASSAALPTSTATAAPKPTAPATPARPLPDPSTVAVTAPVSEKAKTATLWTWNRAHLRPREEFKLLEIKPAEKSGAATTPQRALRPPGGPAGVPDTDQDKQAQSKLSQSITTLQRLQQELPGRCSRSCPL